jgi:EmrB/QacA subfamily drug resistance transporter
MNTVARSFLQNLMAISGLCLVVALVAFNQTVVGSALPTIVSELHGFDLYAWVGTSYLLANVITIPIFGKLGDDHGRRPFVLVAIVLFLLSSLLCGLSQSMLQLVIFRALQGIGGGMLVATAFASIPDLFPHARERLRWQVLFSTSFGLASAIAPPMGGFMAQFWGWRWVFFVSVPTGLLAFSVVWFFLPRIRHLEKPPSRFDYLGAILVAVILGSLQLLTEWLPQGKSMLLLAGLAVVLVGGIAMLLWWERRFPNPIVPLNIFTHSHLGPLFLMSAILGFCMFAVIYYAPLMFQGGFGISPNQAGFLVAPLVFCISVGSILNGRLITRLSSPNIMLYAGWGLFWLSAIGLALINRYTPHGWIVAIMACGGLGLGFIMPNITLFVQATAQRTQLGVASAMVQSTRMVGGMMGTALIGTTVTHAYHRGVSNMLQTQMAVQWSAWLADPQLLVDEKLAGSFSNSLAHAGMLAAPLVSGSRQALVDAIHVSHWIVAGLLLVLLWVIYRLPRVKLSPDE